MRNYVICLSSLFMMIFLYGCEENEKNIVGSVHGIVTDADNNEPIKGATVTLNPLGTSYITGNDGRFEFLKLSSSQYTIQASKSDYQTNSKQITVKPLISTSGDIQLSRGISKIKLNTNILDFGLSSDVLPFSIMNVSTSNAVSWSISNVPEWINVSPESGSVEAGKNTDVAVTVLRNKIKENRNAVIIINANGESLSLTINVKYSPDNGSGGENPSGPNLKAGLVAHYTFDNETAQDATDNGLHANLVNNPNFTSETSSKKGKAIILNGIKEEYINIPYNPFKGQQNYSISMWIKNFGQGVLFSAVSNDYVRSDFPRLLATPEGKFTFFTGYDSSNSTLPFVYPYSSIQDGNWHMITVVSKPTNSDSCIKYLYIDGVLVDSNAGNNYRYSKNECTKIHIGGNADGKYTSFTSSMTVDNIRIYTKSIDADFVKAIYDFEK